MQKNSTRQGHTLEGGGVATSSQHSENGKGERDTTTKELGKSQSEKLTAEELRTKLAAGCEETLDYLKDKLKSYIPKTDCLEWDSPDEKDIEKHIGTHKFEQCNVELEQKKSTAYETYEEALDKAEEEYYRAQVAWTNAQNMYSQGKKKAESTLDREVKRAFLRFRSSVLEAMGESCPPPDLSNSKKVSLAHNLRNECAQAVINYYSAMQTVEENKATAEVEWKKAELIRHSTLSVAQATKDHAIAEAEAGYWKSIDEALNPQK